ncbi:flagellar hook capping FlgD N-terminal domain-containing protein [Deltaproteobacteria bacterium TL4]
MRTNVEQAVNQARDSQRNAATRHGKEGSKELGKQDFLNLLMTQMANQDPMDPMDSKAMMQQMAAMGTVEQLQNLNTKIDQLLTVQGDISRSSASALLEKDVELNSQSINLSGGVASPLSYSLGGDAEKVSIFITNEAGETVRTVSVENQGPGSHHYNWDGLDEDGDVLSNGKYQFNVIAKTQAGEKIEVTQAKKGRVSMLNFENGRPLVKVNGEWLPAEKIKGMGNQSERQFDQALPLPILRELSTRKTLTFPNAEESQNKK